LLESLYAEDIASGVLRVQPKPADPAELADWIGRCNKGLCLMRSAGLKESELSITAAEIDYSTFNRLDRAGFRYFYLRESRVSQAIPEPYRADYCEPAGSRAERLLNELRERLSQVTARVILAPGVEELRPVPVFVYPCQWDEATARITGLEIFGKQVEADLLASVEAEFGSSAETELSEFEQERFSMERFVAERTERFIVGRRQMELEALKQHAEAGRGYLVLTGQPGLGKTALLARFSKDYAASHPEGVTIAHFVGASAASINVRRLLTRLCQELAAHLQEPPEIPDDYDSLRGALAELLKKVAATKRVLIIVDAVNQLDAAHRAETLRWLPAELPDNASMILSAAPGPALEAISRWHHQPEQLELGPLGEEDAGAIVDTFLARYRKTFDSVQRAALLAKRDSGNPLYLTTALEELRTLSTYEEITERIQGLPVDTESLFDWILGRLERDPIFANEGGLRTGEQTVRRYCSTLAAGRSGMSQSELVALVDPGDPKGNLGALQRLLRPYLMPRGELQGFFHLQLRHAVERRYLGAPDVRIAIHHSIADYFQERADPGYDRSWQGENPRDLSELAFHRIEAKEWAEAHRLLTDIVYLQQRCIQGKTRYDYTVEGRRLRYLGVLELLEDYRHAIHTMEEDGAMPPGA